MKASHPLARAFARALGADGVAAIEGAIRSAPVVLLAGDQATGKTTAARTVAARLGGCSRSAGDFVRRRAKAEGLTLEAFNVRMKDDPAADIANDHACTLAVARGEVRVFEGRLAGHIGAFLRELGRKNLALVYLRCQPRERLLRWLEREVGTAAQAAADGVMPAGAGLVDCMEALATLGEPSIVEARPRIEAAAGRDEEDRARLLSVYGLDYTETRLFDRVIDTDEIAPAETAATILAAIEPAGSGYRDREVKEG